MEEIIKMPERHTHVDRHSMIGEYCFDDIDYTLFILNAIKYYAETTFKDENFQREQDLDKMINDAGISHCLDWRENVKDYGDIFFEEKFKDIDYQDIGGSYSRFYHPIISLRWLIVYSIAEKKDKIRTLDLIMHLFKSGLADRLVSQTDDFHWMPFWDIYEVIKDKIHNWCK